LARGPLLRAGLFGVMEVMKLFLSPRFL
jgi:hypothetical protein